MIITTSRVAFSFASASPVHRWRSRALKAPSAAFVSSTLNSSSIRETQSFRHFQSTGNGIQSHLSTRIRPRAIQHNRCASSLHGTSSGSEMTANEIQMKDDALKMVAAAIKAVDPNVAVRDRLTIQLDEKNQQSSKLVAREEKDGGRELVYDLSNYDSIRIISFGKASAAMALAAAEVLSDSSAKKVDGIVIIKDDHATEEEIKTLNEQHNMVVRSASHPVPDARSVDGANEILQLASKSGERTLIIACISGGGSALFCSPREGLTLDDLVATNSRLLESGMPIEHMNVIRKRLERGKGGRLAATAFPASVLTLVLSDIIGDPLDLIASGPTVPDSSGWDDACKLIYEYGLNSGGEHELPKSVLDVLQMGKDGKLEDTPKSSHPAFSTKNESQQQFLTETILVGNNEASVMAAAEEAEKLGYNPVTLGTRVDGEAAVVAGTYVAMAEMLARQRNGFNMRFPIAPLPVALIAGGETTVTLPSDCKGKGGRNQELALAAAVKMNEINMRDVLLASVGTDGTDGPTDAAGAIVHGGIVNDKTLDDAKAAMKNHDAYNFFDRTKETESLVMTGPTGTNVADVCITLVR